MIRFLFLLLVFILLPQSSIAREPLLCEALGQNKTYDTNKSYRKLIEGKDGWIFRTKTDFRSNFKMNEALKGRLTRLYKAFQVHNIDLVIALLPTRGMMHHDYIDQPAYDARKTQNSYKDLVSDLRRIGISVAAVEIFSNNQEFFYKRDHHWKSDGARIMARQVAKEVHKLDVFANIPKRKFKTEEVGEYEQLGTFAKFAQEVCGVTIPAEKIKKYRSFSEGGDLFLNERPADIVLIGTSNSVQSASQANFDGFLREYIGADVDNLSVSGGGVDTAMLDWLTSEEYKNHKPKIVIWEIPIYQNFKGEPFYRQAIPAVYGDCSEDPIVEESADIVDDRFELFQNISVKDISAKYHYLYLKFSDFKKRKFRMTIKYPAGIKEPFNIKRSKFFQPDGTFFLEFDQENESTVNSISGQMPSGTKGTVTARICSYPD